METAQYDWAVTVNENLDHPELKVDTRIPYGTKSAFLRIRTVGPIEDPDFYCDRKHRHIRVTCHKGTPPNPMSGTICSKKTVSARLINFFNLQSLHYVSKTLNAEKYDAYAHKTDLITGKVDEEEKIVIRIVREKKHENEHSAYKVFVNELGLKKAHRLKQIFKDARQTSQKSFEFKTTSAAEYLNDMLGRLEGVARKGIFPPQYTMLASSDKLFLVKFLYLAPFVMDRGDGDNMCGLLISGDPNCGKTRLFKYHPAKRVANDAKGVGRWEIQQAMVFLDDWKLSQIQDTENSSVIRQLGVGDQAEVKIHSTSLLIVPKWLSGTTNDTAFTSMSEADQRRWIWLPIGPLSGKRKHYNPNKNEVVEEVKRHLKYMVLLGVPEFFKASPLSEYIDYIMSDDKQQEDVVMTDSEEEPEVIDVTDGEDECPILPEDVTSIKIEEPNINTPCTQDVEVLDLASPATSPTEHEALNKTEGGLQTILPIPEDFLLVKLEEQPASLFTEDPVLLQATPSIEPPLCTDFDLFDFNSHFA